MSEALKLVDEMITLLDKSTKEDALADVKPIDLSPLVDKNADEKLIQATAREIVDSFHKYGVVVVRDPRVSSKKNDVFLDMFENYFNRPDSEKMSEVHKELNYQSGLTPSHIETARNHCARVETLDPNHKPLTPCPPESDPKWRYFWKVQKKKNDEKKEEFQTLNADNVSPEGIPEWKDVCEDWGSCMLAAAKTISEGVAIGLKLDRDYFTKLLENGPHLLSPTGIDFNKYGKLNTVIAGYHYDLNFISLHGKSRFPGLYVWLRDGRRCIVKVPDGCLIAQAAKQLEWFTGGYIYAGFHEVVVSKQTLEAIERQKVLKRPLWRVSSTMFAHIRSDVTLKLLPQFEDDKTLKQYPQMKAGDQVIEELKAIGLKTD